MLGDGSIIPYRVNPTPNTVNHASTFPAGATSFQVSAEAGSYVGISQNNVLKGAALVPASGTVNVNVTPVTSGQVRIVVTKPQRQPYIQDINVGGAPQSYTINVSANPTQGGTVTGGGTYNQGASCTVTATANTGYTFTNWTENGSVVSTNASYTFTVNGNRTLVANFQGQTQQYTINVSANPTQGGTVTGGGSYNQGASCTVTATANMGYTFSNWTENGNVVSTNANYTFTVTGNRTLVANFTQQQFTITATANPSNGGTVTGGGAYHYGESCTLTATPATGYTFVRWTKNGTQVSTNPNYTFTVTETATYVAQFQAQSYYIAVNANPNNAGTVTGGGSYNFGQTCTLTATPATGYQFINWTKDGTQVSTDATYSFTVTESATYVAQFQTQSFNVTATVNPANSGTTTGSGTYTYGHNCTITATANAGYNFVNWTENGIQISTNPSYSFPVTSNHDFVANFELQTIQITTSVDPNEGGTATGAGIYNYGDEVTINVEPNQNWAFQNWTENGTVVSEEKTFTFIATTDRVFVAHLLFAEGVGEQGNHALTLYPNPVNDKLSVEAQESLGTVEIYNLMGALVYSQKGCANKVDINTSDLPSGIYFIRMTNDKVSQTRRFVKE